MHKKYHKLGDGVLSLNATFTPKHWLRKLARSSEQRNPVYCRKLCCIEGNLSAVSLLLFRSKFLTTWFLLIHVKILTKNQRKEKGIYRSIQKCNWLHCEDIKRAIRTISKRQEMTKRSRDNIRNGHAWRIINLFSFCFLLRRQRLKHHLKKTRLH